jgi:hypothetical protein
MVIDYISRTIGLVCDLENLARYLCPYPHFLFSCVYGLLAVSIDSLLSHVGGCLCM